ncbi:MAG: hypothetical protein GC193_04805 [Cryomorphaceae bacterium]|nr:hypothetical protein [Cryomorphaceae bacterium]
MLKHYLLSIALLGGCWSPLTSLPLTAQTSNSVSFAPPAAATEVRPLADSFPRGKYVMISDNKTTITTIEFTDKLVIERSINENGDGDIKTYSYVSKNLELALQTPFVVKLIEHSKFKQAPEGTVTKQRIKRKEVKAMARMNAWIILNSNENIYDCSVSDESGLTRTFSLKSVK